MVVGDTLVWCPENNNNPHLWIIISDPSKHSGNCVVINLTSSNNGPNAYILKVGDHPYIYKDSDVNFGDAFLTNIKDINAAISSNSATQNQQMNLQIISEIINRAHTHQAFQPILRRYL